MIFRETGLPGLLLIELEAIADNRGTFARIFDSVEWEAHGMPARVAQRSLSRNTRRGTLRGMHYQIAPHEETKLVRCARGAIYDVAVDLRPGSSTYCRWFATELSETNDLMLFIPEGFAHGFLTLVEATEVEYQMSVPYSPDHARAVRWDDPAFGITWPEAPAVIADRDRLLPDFNP